MPRPEYTGGPMQQGCGLVGVQGCSGYHVGRFVCTSAALHIRVKSDFSGQPSTRSCSLNVEHLGGVTGRDVRL